MPTYQVKKYTPNVKKRKHRSRIISNNLPKDSDGAIELDFTQDLLRDRIVPLELNSRGAKLSNKKPEHQYLFED